MAFSKGVLEPRSYIHPQFGRMKKVFIVYAHNPDPYEQYIPPFPPEQLYNDHDLFKMVWEYRSEHIRKQQLKIQTHKYIVRCFAECLKSNGIPVFYDQHSETSSNVLANFEQQMVDSDVVVVIITPSLKYYLNNDAPVDVDEILLTRHFLYNLMTVNKPDGTHFLPVFLNQPSKRDLIPTVISGSTCYSILEPFDCTEGDFQSLYAFLTNQKVAEIFQPSSVIKLPKRKSPFAFVPKTKTDKFMSPHHGQLYNELRLQSIPVAQSVFFELASEITSFWQKLAHGLHLSKREIQECITIAGSGNDREASYQMLRLWQETNPESATISKLAEALHGIHCYHLFYILNSNQ